MDDNPYSAPRIDDAITDVPPSVLALRPLAQAQRGVQLVALAYCALIPVYAWTEITGATEAQSFWVMAYAVAVLIAGIYFVIRLAYLQFGPGWAVVCAALMLVPLVGLIMLERINRSATVTLRAAGLRVGLLGVPASEFTRRRP